MSALTEQIHSLNTSEKLAVLDMLVNDLAPKFAEDYWPVEELDRRCKLVDEGKMEMLPFEEAKEKLSREFLEWRNAQ